jgi:glycine/D-amino acid oxidase-like deaminating enzyme
VSHHSIIDYLGLPVVIRRSLDQGLNLQTYTPATSMTRSESDPSRWTVHTDRGDITATHVVVCTNAYTSSLLPEFRPKIIPVRGTACSITPAPSHSAGSLPGPIKYTYGIRFGTGEVDYMIPRQGRGRVTGRGDQSIILGGAKGCFLSKPDEWYDNKYDNEEMPGVRKYFEGYMAKYFNGWNGDEKGNVDHVWSGGASIPFTILRVLNSQSSATRTIYYHISANIPRNQESSLPQDSQGMV